MKRAKQISIMAASILSPLLLVQLNAEDLIVSSGMPVIDFDDTNTVGDDWRISGNRNYWYLRNQVNNVVAMRFPKQAVASNSFIAEVDTGNISLADGSVFIDRSENRMGIGTRTPEAPLHVIGAINSTWAGSNTEDDGLTNLLVLSANNSEADLESDAGFGLKNAREDIQWNFRTHQNGTAFVATLAGTGGPEFTVKNATGNVSGTELYLGNGAKNVGGVWIDASSRALKENIKDLSTQDALAAFHQLQPVTYNYKSDKKEQVVGFIAEDVPELVAIQSRDGLSSMDMVAVLTKVVQEQEKINKVQEEELKAKEEKISNLEARMNRLETILTEVTLIMPDTIIPIASK